MMIYKHDLWNLPTKITFFFSLIYLFNVLFCNRVLSYFAKPNFIVYDEWFDNDFKKIKIFQNIILENVSEKINENLFFTLCNIVEQDNKYLIVTSESSIVNIDFKLNDLKSRSKNFLLQNIDKPDDELLFALILKNLSDRQISIDKKLIDYIIKRIDRSYGKIVDFIYKIDEVSLKKKRSINLSTIKEVLGE